MTAITPHRSVVFKDSDIVMSPSAEKSFSQIHHFNKKIIIK